MKFVRRYNLKKVLVSSCLLLFIALFSGFLLLQHFYKMYRNETNQYIAFLIEEIKENYSDVDEEKLIQELNKKMKGVNKAYLLKYGLDIENDSLLNSYNEIYKEELIWGGCFCLLFFISLLSIYFFDSYKKNKEIKKITETIHKVNGGEYELVLGDYYEGDLSILKDEVYKTTLMLKEAAMNSLKGKNQLKDSIANISHQLKTPLTSILIMTDNLLDEQMDEKTRKEFLEDIQYQVENMNFLIIAMLKLSRFDADVVSFKRETLNVKSLLLSSLKNVNALADAKNITIHIRGDNVASFLGDFAWEVEALTNLLKNCIEHTNSDKNIYVKYTENHFYTKIVIEDEGVGIDADELKHIFERFYKGKNSGKNSIGIGLALAKEIIEKDDGSISVQSIKNKGTIFTIKYFK